MSRRYVIEVPGDNDRLHEEAIRAAVRAAEQVGHVVITKAWLLDLGADPQALPLCKPVNVR